jgi:hypothetical protein
MVSQGRALAVAAAWVILPLGAAALGLGLSATSEDALGVALVIGGISCLIPLSLLASAIWVARRATRAKSAAALGAQAGLIGLAVMGLAVAIYVAFHWN